MKLRYAFLFFLLLVPAWLGAVSPPTIINWGQVATNTRPTTIGGYGITDAPATGPQGLPGPIGATGTFDPTVFVMIESSQTAAIATNSLQWAAADASRTLSFLGLATHSGVIGGASQVASTTALSTLRSDAQASDALRIVAEATKAGVASFAVGAMLIQGAGQVASPAFVMDSLAASIPAVLSVPSGGTGLTATASVASDWGLAKTNGGNVFVGVQTVTGSATVSGNFAVGLTSPQTNYSTYKGIEAPGISMVGHPGGNDSYLFGNMYLGPSGFGRINAGGVCKLQMYDGEYQFQTCGTGTAGTAFTPVIAMTIASATGNVGIGTSTPQTGLHNSGFTMLGDSSPKIKCKKLTGTTNSTEGTFVDIPHGLTGSKIISFRVLVDYNNDGSGIVENTGTSISAGLQYHTSLSPNDIRVLNDGVNSENILSKPIRILVWYEE